MGADAAVTHAISGRAIAPSTLTASLGSSSTCNPRCPPLRADYSPFISLPQRGHKFSGDINGLECFLGPPKAAFLLASVARFLYPMELPYT